MASTQPLPQYPAPPVFASTTVIVTLMNPSSSSLAKLTFSDGYEYVFVRHHLFHRAVAYRDYGMRSPNQLLAITGDAQIKTKLAAQGINDSKQYNTTDWNFWYSQILATQRFQALRVDQLGLFNATNNLVLSGAPPTAREKSTTLEVLVGAVAVDCEFHHPTIEKVIRALGIFWPYADEDKAALRQIFNL